MELIMKFLSLFSSTEAFVKDMWQWRSLFPILLVGFWITLIIGGLLVFLLSRKKERDDSFAHMLEFHTNLPVLRRLLGGSTIGNIIDGIVLILYLIVSCIWTKNFVVEVEVGASIGLYSSVAIICAIHLLLTIYLIIAFVKEVFLSLLSRDIRCCITGFIVIIYLSCTGLFSFIYAMMWYFSTV